jgi:hypothetical protein
MSDKVVDTTEDCPAVVDGVPILIGTGSKKPNIYSQVDTCYAVLRQYSKFTELRYDLPDQPSCVEAQERIAAYKTFHAAIHGLTGKVKDATTENEVSV